MDNKILLQDMASSLSAKFKLKQKDSEAFLKTFFEIVSEYVHKEKIVKVKGLGTFKLIEVSDRESVKINTGERYVIPGHSKVTFTPDAELKAKVNKPFELFQTVILNEDTNIEDMERIYYPTDNGEQDV
ncbi:HU family DNA-binding protein, partial [bacterium]|nr:HU family DNA-binding protein [bacterium]